MSHTTSSKRTNSITSFSSFQSYASSTMNPQKTAKHIPRGSSTNDLFMLDSKFSRPSRAKPLRSSASMVSLASSPNTAGQRFNSITSTHSTQQMPMPRSNSLQPGMMSDIYHSSFRHSTSSTNLSSHRKQSVEQIHINKMKQQFYLQQRQQQSIDNNQQQQNASSRRNSHMPQVPFTFPNGEVYIPRNKQRNSCTNLNNLNIETSALNQSVPISPRSPKKPSSLMLVPKSTKSSTQPQVYYHESSISSVSNSNSHSSSPSPSRASRTNSSLNESTPPSSIDDLSIQPTVSGPINNHEKSSEQLAVVTTSNLGMIEEHSPITNEPSMLLPSPVTSSDTPTTEAKSDSPKTNEITMKPAEKADTKAKAPVPTVVKAPVKPRNSVQSLKTVSVERKPSALKRFFSKVFSSKKSKPSKPVTVTQTPPKAKDAVRKPINKDTPTNTSSAKLTKPPQPTNENKHPLQREVSLNSDVFSFIEGDEDNGITVVDLMDIKLAEPDFGDQESPLGSMFSNIGKEVQPSAMPLETENKLVMKKVRDKTPPAEEEDAVITFDDMEFIEKMIEYGETSFPDLSANDLGQSQRKMMRSKSIERRKSIRSISSASKLSIAPSEASTLELQELNELSVEPTVHVVYTNKPKTPQNSLSSRPSILKKKAHYRMSVPSSSKKVGFTNKIYVNNTYPSHLYNRHSTAVSSYQLSPQLIQQIRQELNEFKRSMVVHEESFSNTQFFRS